MTHRQGYYHSPQHDTYRQRILAHIAHTQPAFGVIMTEDAMPISEAWQAYRHSICARVWAIDDGGGNAGKQLDANPQAAAQDLLTRYLRKRDEWYASRLPLPEWMWLYGHAWNEPNQWTSYEKVVEGTKYLLAMAQAEAFPFMVSCLGVGHPSGLNADGSVDWSAFDDAELQHLILATGSVVDLHGYWQVEGPMHQWTDEQGNVRRDYPYLAGRHHSFPLDVPIVIGEAGIDGGIYNRNPGWGWQAYRLEPSAYSNQLHVNHDALDHRVLAQCPFALDYQDKAWASFNYVDCLGAIEDWVGDEDTPTDVYIPVVVNGAAVSTGIIDPNMALAIMDVEAGSEGFGPDGGPIIRFEAHIFKQQLGNDELFDQYFRIADQQPWAKPQYYLNAQRAWTPIHSGSQRDEQLAFGLARTLNAEAAHKSISMGIAQVLGMNHARVGYASAQQMYKDFSESEAAQIVAFFNYVLSDPALVRAIRDKDFETIARLYNGAGNVTVYSGLLREAYERRKII